MAMDIIDLYRSILAAAGLHTTSDGFVQVKTRDGAIYATKDGKKLVLPTLEQLRSATYKDCLVFHPLSENTLQSESEVLTFYRHLLVARVNAVVGSLGMELLTLAASTASHKDLSPDQAEFLAAVDEPDQRTIDDWVKLAKAMPATQVQKAFVSIFLKKTGRVAGQSYARVASVNFPLYAQLLEWEKVQGIKKADRAQGIKEKKGTAPKGQYQIYDVSLREKDRDTLMGILKYLIVQIDTPEMYHRGSNSSVAPSLDALMHAFRAVAGRINDIVDLFEGTIPDVELFRFNADWVESFDNLEVMWPQIRQIPAQGQTEAMAVATAQALLSNPQQQVMAAMAGTAQVSPVPFQPVQQVYQPVPAQPAPLPWANLQNPPPPPPPPATPVYWQLQQPQQQQPRTGHGVSMAALMQANPVLAAVAYGQIPQQQQQYGVQQNTWPPQNQQQGIWPPYGQPTRTY